MTPEEWTRIRKLFEEAAELDEAGRLELLARLDREDATAAAQLRSLLAEFDSAEEKPFSDAFERVIADLGVRTPERIGEYRVVRELGRGGAAIVFLCIRESDAAHTVVALKLLRQYGWDRGRERRFVMERRILARLKHAGIARFFDWGLTPEGMPYLVMEYVDGEPLDAYCQRNSLDVRQRLELFLQVLDAVEFAHKNSIVHRDLKPGNILVTPRGQVKLLDFGISKLLEASVDATATVERRFTPAYASPEQVRGEAAAPATDIYALGVILYQLVTGSGPYRVETTTVEEMSEAVLHDVPAPPSESARGDRGLRAQVGPELDAIVLHALEKDAGARYASVEDFAAAVRRCLAGQPASGRRSSRMGWKGKAACIVACVGAAVAMLAFGWRERAQPRNVTLATEKVISGDATLSAYPALSPDGSTLVYASDRGGGGTLHLWMQPWSGGNPVQLTRGERNDLDPTITPDGRWVAFRSEREPRGIYLASTQPGAAGEEFIAPFGLSPRYSTDGKWLTFWTRDPTTDFGIAWKMPVDRSREPMRVARNFDDLHYPGWIADGTKLVACGTRRSNGGPTEEHDFWVIDRDSDQAFKTGALAVLQRLKINPHTNYLAATSFQWLSSGVVFTGEQAGKPGVWMLPLDPKTWTVSGEPYRLHNAQGTSELHPAIRGNHAAMTEMQVRVAVWMLPLDANAGKATGKLRRVSSAGGMDLMPCVARDGDTVVFLRQSDEGMRPYRVNADGRESVLSAGGREANRLKVSGDGRYAFYRVLEGPSSDIQRQAIYRIEMATGRADRVCANCGGPTGASDDGRFVLFETGSAIARIAVLRVGKEERWDLLRHSHHALGSARMSADGRWVAFVRDQGFDGRQILVAPFRENGLAEDWVAITAEHDMADEPWWSPDGKRLYYVDRRDGFACIWTRTWNAAKGRPEGEAEAVQHFHETRMGPLTAVNRAPRYIGLSVARDRLVLAMSEITGAIRGGELKH